MGRPERQLKRKHAQGRPAAAGVDLGNLKKLPELIEEVISENKKITDENKRLQDAVGEILEDFANRISALEKLAGTHTEG